MALLETPAKIYVQFTNDCNQNCYHCYMRCNRDVGRSELSLDEWKRVVDELSEENVLQLYIEGGEPLARADFFDFLDYAGKRFCVWFRTNATLIDDGVAARLARLNVGYVFVDLLGATPETHDFFAGRPGAFDKALAGVRALTRAGIATSIVTIMNRRNIGELQQFVDLAAELGIPRAGILRLYPIGRVKDHWDDLVVPLADQTAALAALRVPAGVHLMQSWHPNDANCCGENAGINAWGDSIGCPYLREFVHYGNVREQRFMETWDHPLYKQLRTADVPGACEQCADNEGSRGGCRSAAYAFTGRWDAPDPLCTVTNGGTDIRVLPDWLVEGKTQSPDATLA